MVAEEVGPNEGCCCFMGGFCDSSCSFLDSLSKKFCGRPLVGFVLFLPSPSSTSMALLFLLMLVPELPFVDSGGGGRPIFVAFVFCNRVVCCADRRWESHSDSDFSWT